MDKPVATANKLYSKTFSICTIVNNMAEYYAMKKSFEKNGFTDNCEYLIVDNCIENTKDAYAAINHFLQIATGQFVVMVHQDVRAIDNASQLLTCIETLNSIDKNWAICGNAGGKGYHQFVYHITQPNEVLTSNNLPQKVNSLDENLLVIKNGCGISASAALKGFHLYGTVLCIVANILSCTSYVIPFMVEHLSKGNLKALAAYKSEFINNYAPNIHIGFVQTTCTSFYLTKSTTANRLLNSRIIFFVVKQYFRYKYLLGFRA
jgi:hypothetical protein